MECVLKSLTDFGLANKKDKPESGFKANFFIGGLLLDLAYAIKGNSPRISIFMTEIAGSLVNSRWISNNFYGRLCDLHNQAKTGLKQGVELEQFMSELAFGFITSAKSNIDLFACCIDLIINRKLRYEYQMLDLKKLKINSQDFPSTSLKIDNFRNSAWCIHLNESRNRIVHRGYLPKFTHDSKDSTILKVTLERKDLSWTGKEEELHNGFIKDGKGNTIGELDINGIALIHYKLHKTILQYPWVTI